MRKRQQQLRTGQGREDNEVKRQDDQVEGEIETGTRERESDGSSASDDGSSSGVDTVMGASSLLGPSVSTN
jgi:hypothetical protein